MHQILPSTYQHPYYPFKRSPDQDAGRAVRHQVVIIGAGPTGLVCALDLARRGIPSVIFSQEHTTCVGSRAICFAKKTLEIIHRINRHALDKMLAKGVVWNVGKVFYQQKQVYEFNLLPEEGHKIPAFINLQQYYFEQYLIEEAHKEPLIDLRWQSKALFLRQDEEKADLEIETPEGNYRLEAAFVLACDGVRSPTREALQIPFEGETFDENFLISDVVMEKEFPTERWFWFDPPFNRGYSALLHKQPDGVWRIDLQLGRQVDKEEELRPEKIKARIREMLGPEVRFTLEWTSVYQFRCMRIKDFIHQRVIFLGDAAHLVSPFGARGANGGIQDADNLIWKLARVLKEEVPWSFLQTYQEERSPATDENIYHSSNATDFITPKSGMSLTFRNETLRLAENHEFARQLVNSGRLSHAFAYVRSSLTSFDEEAWEGGLQPGSTFKDAWVHLGTKSTYLIDLLQEDFNLLVFGMEKASFHPKGKRSVHVIHIPLARNDLFRSRYDAQPGTWYLLRPDRHVAARGKTFNPAAIQAALDVAMGKGNPYGKRIAEEKNPRYPYDGMYKKLIRAHAGRTEEESHALNARLILLLMQACKDEAAFEDLLRSASSPASSAEK